MENWIFFYSVITFYIYKKQSDSPGDSGSGRGKGVCKLDSLGSIYTVVGESQSLQVVL